MKSKLLRRQLSHQITGDNATDVEKAGWTSTRISGGDRCSQLCPLQFVSANSKKTMKKKDSISGHIVYVQVCIVCRFMPTTRNKQQETFSWTKSCSSFNSLVPFLYLGVNICRCFISRMASLHLEWNRLGQNLWCGDVGFVNMYKGLLPNLCGSGLFWKKKKKVYN